MDRKIRNLKKKYQEDGQLRRRIHTGCLLIAVCCLFGGVLARYIHQTVTENSQISADRFYFTANLLGDTKMVTADGGQEDTYTFGEKSTEGTWYLYGASEHKIKVKVQNYFDELRVTDGEIAYTGSVTVTGPDGQTIAKDAGTGSVYPEWKQGTGEKEETLVSFSSGTLDAKTGDEKQNDTTLTLDIPSHTQWNYTDGTVVTAKIVSTSPYKKTLTMNFVLYATDTTLKYQVVDSVGSPYAELILMTNVDSAIQPYLIWPDGLEIDNTNPLTFTYNSENGTFTQQSGMENRNMQISEPLQTGRSESIYFFKSDTSRNYSCEERIVVQDSSDKYVIDLNK